MSIQQSNYLLLGFQRMILTLIQIKIFHISNWTVNLNVVHDVENVAPVIGEKKYISETSNGTQYFQCQRLQSHPEPRCRQYFESLVAKSIFLLFGDVKVSLGPLLKVADFVVVNILQLGKNDKHKLVWKVIFSDSPKK